VNTSTPQKESRKTGDFWWPGRFAFSERNGQRIPNLAGDARGEGGFSLIEVTIAMGVMAFAAIAILGIIPNGLSAAGEATFFL
jgi:type II secretory pathway pseudopilin PulG